MLRNGRVLGASALIVGLLAGAWWLTGDGRDLVDPGCGGVAEGPGGLIGFDPDTGMKRWSATVGLPTGAAAFDDVIVVSGFSGALRAFDTSTGEQIWCADLATGSRESQSNMVGARSNVVAFDGDDLVAFEPSTGAEAWRRSVPGVLLMLVGGDAVWLTDGSAEGSVVAVVDPETGLDMHDPPSLPRPNASFGYRAAPTGFDDWELTAKTVQRLDAQLIDIAVSRAGATVWEREVPGFVAALAETTRGPMTLVIDQTGGTGERLGADFDTRLTAYSASDGEQAWQIALPGTPHLITPLIDDLVIVPVGTELHGIDPATGDIRWVVDHGSPGSKGRYSFDGTYRLLAGGSSGTVVGLVEAEQPYRD